MNTHPLIGKTVTYSRMEKPKGKRKEVLVTRTGTVEDVSMIGRRELAMVKVAVFCNGGATLCHMVNTSDLKETT